MFLGSLVYKVVHSAAFHDTIPEILHIRTAEVVYYVLSEFSV